MNDPNWWLDMMGVSRGTALASFIGALFSFRFLDRAIPLPWRLAMVPGGFAAAIFLTPGVLAAFSFPTDYAGGVGLGLGLFSMNLIDALAVTIKNGRILEKLLGRFGL